MFFDPAKPEQLILTAHFDEIVQSFLERQTSPDGQSLQPRLRGSLRHLLVPRIFVSGPHHRILANLPDRDRDLEQRGVDDPRFTATVSWGKNYAPWLQEVRLR